MAPSTSPSPVNIAAALSAAITIKLDQDNFLLWKAQALPALYGNELYGFVDGTHADQQVLSDLLASLTPPVLGHVQLLKTAAKVWEALDRMFASRSKAWIVQLSSALVKPKRRDMSMSDYFHHMKKIADTMATIGNPLGDDEIVSYVLSGLGDDHDNFATSMSVIAGNNNFTLSDLYGHMTAYEARTGDRTPGTQFQHSANNTSRGRGNGGGFTRGGGGRGRGDGGRGNYGGNYGDNGGGHGNYGGNYGGNGGGHGNYGGNYGGGRGDNSGRGNAQGGGRGRGGKSTCQICGVYGHDALRCYSRFNHAIQPETSNRSANFTSSNDGYTSEPTWLMDSGATDHMTNDIERLHVQLPLKTHHSPRMLSFSLNRIQIH
ncbi:unnamed protein product [Alopecurus aequalis]